MAEPIYHQQHDMAIVLQLIDVDIPQGRISERRATARLDQRRHQVDDTAATIVRPGHASTIEKSSRDLLVYTDLVNCCYRTHSRSRRTKT